MGFGCECFFPFMLRMAVGFGGVRNRPVGSRPEVAPALSLGKEVMV